VRIRQIKPAFWADARIAELPEPTRLFYVGLWMIADDAGWLRWDPIEVARDLYGYESRRRRERRVVAMFDQLVTAGRVMAHPCGHAEVPTLTEHQHLGGSTKQVRTVFNDHTRGCLTTPRESPRMPADARIGKERSGTDVVEERERNGTVRNGNARKSDETESEFRERVGLPAFMAGRS